MANLKAYRDEHQKYPREQRIKLSSRMAQLLTWELSKRFDVKLGIQGVRMSTRGNGKCHAGYGVAYIDLPYNGCSLGMVLHELAHAYNRQKYNNNGHTGTFKNALSVLYHHSRPMLKEILLKLKAQIEKERVDTAAAIAKSTARAVRTEAREKARAEFKKSRAYRIQHLQKRISA